MFFLMLIWNPYLKLNSFKMKKYLCRLDDKIIHIKYTSGWPNELGFTQEMVKILQENSEVVATMGSSANYRNMRIFLAADASLAVEPLYPQVGIFCLRC